MNLFSKKHFWLTAMVISITVPVAHADDLFDDSFFANPAPVDAVGSTDPAPKTDQTPDPAALAAPAAPVPDAPAPVVETADAVPVLVTGRLTALSEKASQRTIWNHVCQLLFVFLQLRIMFFYLIFDLDLRSI